MDKDKTIRKWFPILNNVGFKNKKIVEILSIYCEKRSNLMNSTSELKELFKKNKKILI